jgi:hypothetical protein
MRFLWRLFGLVLLAGVFLGASGQCWGAGEPELLRIFPVDGSCVSFPVSGVLQEGDKQFVHDLFCKETGRRLGMVRMRWAYKYGARYGGVGYMSEGVSAEWGGAGLVKVCFSEPVGEVVVVPRLAPIEDR